MRIMCAMGMVIMSVVIMVGMLFMRMIIVVCVLFVPVVIVVCMVLMSMVIVISMVVVPVFIMIFAVIMILVTMCMRLEKGALAERQDGCAIGIHQRGDHSVACQCVDGIGHPGCQIWANPEHQISLLQRACLRGAEAIFMG
jgi:hypothetical protein